MRTLALGLAPLRAAIIALGLAVSSGGCGGAAESGADPPDQPEPAVVRAEPVPDLPLPDLPVPDLPTVEQPDPLHAEVGPGDSLSRILHRVGIDATTIARVTGVLEPHMDPATIRVGQRFDIELDPQGNLQSFLFRRSMTETIHIDRGEDDTYEARLEALETTVVTEALGGTVRSSLWAAMTDGGHDPALVDVVVDVFAYDIDFFTATREGDTFRLIVERHEIDGEFVRYGRVLAAQYAGASASANVFWWPSGRSGEGRYVDEEGRGVTRTLLKTPLKYSRVSSTFNPARMHPVLHRVKSHKGVDYAAAEGTAVWAAADGVIAFRGKQGGAGNMVVLSHSGGLKTLYMHLSKFRDGQSVGDKVRAKTVIGHVGQTGLATGPHLHFGVQKNGRYVDPQSIEPTRGPGVGRAERSAFSAERERWSEQLAALEL